MDNGQLEFSLRKGYVNRRACRTQRSRARWWFERMRQVVERAMDRRPAPPPPPEQMVFAGSYRSALAASDAER